jgi:hypothetical protein
MQKFIYLTVETSQFLFNVISQSHKGSIRLKKKPYNKYKNNSFQSSLVTNWDNKYLIKVMSIIFSALKWLVKPN